MVAAWETETNVIKDKVKKKEKRRKKLILIS